MLQLDELSLLDELEDVECGLQRVVGVDNFKNGTEVEDRVIVLSLRRKGKAPHRYNETQVHAVSLIPSANLGAPPTNNGRPPTLLYSTGKEKDTWRMIVHATTSPDKRLLIFTEYCVSPSRVFFRTIAVLKDKSEVEILSESLSYSVYFLKPVRTMFFGEEWHILCVSDRQCLRIKVESDRHGKLSSSVEDNRGCVWHQWDAVTRQLVLLNRGIVWLFDFTKGTDAYMKYELKGHRKFVPAGESMDVPLPTAPLPYSSGNRSSRQEMNFAFLEFYRESGEKDYVLCQQRPAIVMDRDEHGDVIGQVVLNKSVLEVNIDVWRSLQRLVLCVDLTPYLGSSLNPDENPLFKALLQDNAVGFRATFCIVNSVLCIVLPNVCVSYVDITHRNRPPRYLFTAAWPESERIPTQCLSMLPLQCHPSRVRGHCDFDSVAVWFTPCNHIGPLPRTRTSTTKPTSSAGGEEGVPPHQTSKKLGTWFSYSTKARMWNWITFQLANRGSVQKIRRALHLVTMHVPIDGTTPQSPNISTTTSPTRPAPISDRTPQGKGFTGGSGSSPTAGQRSPGGNQQQDRDQDVPFLIQMFKKVSYRLLTADVLVEYLLSSTAKHWGTHQRCRHADVPFDGECLQRSEELLLTGPKRHPPGFVPTVPVESSCFGGGGTAVASPTSAMPISKSMIFGPGPGGESISSPYSPPNVAGRTITTDWDATQRSGSDLARQQQQATSQPTSATLPLATSTTTPTTSTNGFLSPSGPSFSSAVHHHYQPQQDVSETINLDAPFQMFPNDVEGFILRPNTAVGGGVANNTSRRLANRGNNPLSMTASIRLIDRLDTAPSTGGDSEYIHQTTAEFKRALVGLSPGDAHQYATLYHTEMKSAVLRVFKAFRVVFDKSPRKFFHVLHNLQHALTALSFPAPPDVQYEMTSLACKLLPPEALVEGMRSGIYRTTVNPESETFVSSSSGGFRDPHGGSLDSTRGSATGVSVALGWNGHKDVVLGNVLPLCSTSIGAAAAPSKLMQQQRSVTSTAGSGALRNQQQPPEVDLQSLHYPLYHNLLTESTIHDQDRDTKYIRCEQLYHDTRPCLQLMDDHLPKECPVTAPAPLADWYGQAGSRTRSRTSSRNVVMPPSVMENMGLDEIRALYEPFSRADPWSDEGPPNGLSGSKAEFRRHSKRLLNEGIAGSGNNRKEEGGQFSSRHLD